jgi:hypothetical protein
MALIEVEMTGTIEIIRYVHSEGLNPLDEKIDILICSS